MIKDPKRIAKVLGKRGGDKLASFSSHEFYVKIGKMAASKRWGKDYLGKPEENAVEGDQEKVINVSTG